MSQGASIAVLGAIAGSALGAYLVNKLAAFAFEDGSTVPVIIGVLSGLALCITTITIIIRSHQ